MRPASILILLWVHVLCEFAHAHNIRSCRYVTCTFLIAYFYACALLKQPRFGGGFPLHALWLHSSPSSKRTKFDTPWHLVALTALRKKRLRIMASLRINRKNVSFNFREDMNASLLKSHPNTSRQSAPFVCVSSENLVSWTAVETDSVGRALSLYDQRRSHALSAANLSRLQ